MAKTKSDNQSRREQRRLQHQDLSRAQLLDAAEESFGRKGFHETTLKEVARNDIGERTLASYAVSGDTLLLRTEGHLYRIEEKK